jgi:hypothetical protein
MNGAQRKSPGKLRAGATHVAINLHVASTRNHDLVIFK